MRPKDSIDLTNFTEPALFFGDETSLAAAQALHRCRRQTGPARYVFEVNSPVQAEVVLRKFGVSQASLVQKREDGSHLADVVLQMAEQAARMQSPQWVFTGQAHSILSVRKGLKQAGISLFGSKVKAYWSPGRRAVHKKGNSIIYTANPKDCGSCSLKQHSTSSPQRRMSRHMYEDAIKRMNQRATPAIMRLRRSIVEHPFSTIKYQIFGHPRLLLRGQACSN
jgi:hypothetical protein